MSHRTPRIWIVIKMTLCVWVFFAFFNWAISEHLFEFWWTFVTIACWMWGISFIIQFLGFVLFGRNTEYKKARKKGWHPYWDQIPPPFNNDCYAVRLGGIPEPKTQFKPPADWSLQCLRCGARNEDWATQCWECKAALERPPAETPNPRHCYCPHCNKKFLETKYGDLDNGVLCPFCHKLVRTVIAENVLRMQQTPQAQPTNRFGGNNIPLRQN